jgi:hypothetical protein
MEGLVEEEKSGEKKEELKNNVAARNYDFSIHFSRKNLLNVDPQ